MMTPEQAAGLFIFHWEDGEQTDPNKTHSMKPNDRGNWTGGAQGSGVLVGSNHGVTARALAAYRKMPVASITVAIMHALTADEACKIALATFYHDNHLDRLPWNAVTASAFDFGYGAGPITTIMHLQRLSGVDDDGIAGFATATAYQHWLDRLGIEAAAKAWAVERLAYYRDVIRAHPEQAENLPGWTNRTAYYKPGTPWWAKFNGGKS